MDSEFEEACLRHLWKFSWEYAEVGCEKVDKRTKASSRKLGIFIYFWYLRFEEWSFLVCVFALFGKEITEISYVRRRACYLYYLASAKKKWSASSFLGKATRRAPSTHGIGIIVKGLTRLLIASQFFQGQIAFPHKILPLFKFLTKNRRFSCGSGSLRLLVIFLIQFFFYIYICYYG